MATPTKSKGSTKASSPRPTGHAARRSPSKTSQKNAIELLKGDHREVEQLFGEFKKSRSESKQRELTRKICLALKVHTQIEEEIFYPAFFEATDEEDIHHEAIVEHAGAKDLIAKIEQSTAEDDYYEARVTVLSEMIKHHVNEEEKRGGMFAKAKAAEMDLAALGEQLAERKQELMSTEGQQLN